MHIHIVHVEPDNTFSIAGTSRRELELREEKIADHFRRHGVGSNWTLRFGSQQDHLLDQARLVSADLLCHGMAHPSTDPSEMRAQVNYSRSKVPDSDRARRSLKRPLPSRQRSFSLASRSPDPIGSFNKTLP